MGVGGDTWRQHGHPLLDALQVLDQGRGGGWAQFPLLLQHPHHQVGERLGDRHVRPNQANRAGRLLDMGNQQVDGVVRFKGYRARQHLIHDDTE